MKLWPWCLLLVLTVCATLYGFCFGAGLRAAANAVGGGRCYPTDAPTGRVMCFSDGVLVYMTQTYRNGGVLCTNDGIELKLPKDLCIEESRQVDAWSPPPPRKDRTHR